MHTYRIVRDKTDVTSKHPIAKDFYQIVLTELSRE